MSTAKHLVKLTVLTLLVSVLSAPVATAAMKSQTFTGTDDNVITIKSFKEAAIITAEYEGEDNFVVRPLDANGEQGSSWFNEIDSWSGTVYQAPSTKAWAGFTVETVGTWKITISPISSAPQVNSKKFSGSGVQVVKFSAVSKGLKRATITHSGESNFVVLPIENSGKRKFSMVNEIGNYSGTTLLPQGTRYMAIVADGDWNVSIK